MNLNAYSPQIVIGACTVIVLILLAAAWAIHRQRSLRRTAALRSRFGTEYDIAVQEFGSRSRAEAELEARLKRVGNLQFRTLAATERSRLLADWDSIQGRFIDHPRGAVTEADELINNLLQMRGYAGERFEQRAADLSVHHARLVDSYRRANAIVARAGKNESTTEELRTAMILYRALLEELLQSKTVAMDPRAKAA